MTCLSLVRLVPRPAARILGGQVLLDGEDLLTKSEREMQRIRGRRVAMILQDPMSSLNPVFSIGMQMREPVGSYHGLRGRALTERAAALLASVRIPSPAERLRAFPHQLSGGMRQRVVGAMAIAGPPRLLIADEPTTSLDLTIQAQYLNLLKELQEHHRLAMIFVTHNLGIVARMCDNVAVMYAGRIVELGARPADLHGARSPLHARPAGVRSPSGRARRAPHRHRWPAPRPREAPPGVRVRPALLAGHGSVPDRRAARRRAEPGPHHALLAARGAMTSAPLLEVAGLTKHFTVRRGALGWSTALVRAVDSISFTLDAGRTLGVVGESGCGKTTTSKLILGLERPTAGAIRFEGQDVVALDREGRRQWRRSVQAVFQDPYASLDPRMRVGTIVAEPLVINADLDAATRRRRVAELLDLVGLPERASALYPHEFSGGQRQRIAVARALALSPKLVVLDEPVSALDVSIRAQILNLLTDLQKRLDVSYLFIAHDLAAVAHMSHAIAVMYLGKLVEWGDADAVALEPKHPYTKALFAAALPVDLDGPRADVVLSGEVPSPIDPPGGCRFHPRCPFAMPHCATEEPPLLRGRPGDWSPATSTR